MTRFDDWQRVEAAAAEQFRIWFRQAHETHEQVCEDYRQIASQSGPRSRSIVSPLFSEFACAVVQGHGPNAPSDYLASEVAHNIQLLLGMPHLPKPR